MNKNLSRHFFFIFALAAPLLFSVSCQMPESTLKTTDVSVLAFNYYYNEPTPPGPFAGIEFGGINTGYGDFFFDFDCTKPLDLSALVSIGGHTINPGTGINGGLIFSPSLVQSADTTATFSTNLVFYHRVPAEGGPIVSEKCRIDTPQIGITYVQ